jgi:thymidylate synthase (FAD)
MEPTIDVLDHGYVKLIGHLGSDEAIVEAARMSTGRGFVSWEPYYRCKRCDEVQEVPNDAHLISGAEEMCQHDWQHFPEGDKGTLDYLWRHKHATPFEMGELVIEVQAPIMVFREWHRHRTQSFNEFSARYSEMPNLHYVPNPSRFEHKKSDNKQESSAVSEDQKLGPTPEEFRFAVLQEQSFIYQTYQSMLDHGVPKEVARLNTPVSRYSKMRAKANLRNWLGFLNLRMRPNAQKEIRLYAEAVATLVKGIWPRTYSLFEEYDLYGVSLSRTELAQLRKMLSYRDDDLTISGSKGKEFLKKLHVGGKEVL